MVQPTLVSLFSGAGGLDYGFEQAGFRTGVAVEMDSWCCRTLRASRPRWEVVERNIAQVKTSEMLQRAGTKAGDLDLVIGGPPCQPFSKAGYWVTGDTRRLADPRAHTLAEYLRVIEQAQPRAFLLENVEGLAYSEKDDGYAFLRKGVRAVNRRLGTRYKLSAAKVNAASYGVPQLRTRFIVVGSREGDEFDFPAPTHAAAEEFGESGSGRGLLPYTTAWQSIGDLSPPPDLDLAPTGRWAELLPTIPEGQNYLWHTSKGIELAKASGAGVVGHEIFGWRRHFWTFLLKLAKDRPSWTLQAQPGPAVGPFHWDSRRFSPRELARLQTFPDDVHLQGPLRAAQKQAGNAVPSRLAEAIAREIRTQLLGLPPIRRPSILLPQVDLPVPPPAKVAKLPAAFDKLVGSHESHPGTGEGYGAKRRPRPAEQLNLGW